MEPQLPSVSDLYQEEIYQLKNRVLIVLSVPWESLSKEDKILLSKILGAVRLSLDGVHIISEQKPDPQSLKKFLPKWIILFSNESDNEFPYYMVTSLDGVPLIKSHELKDLDDGRKKSLWTVLKSLMQG